MDVFLRRYLIHAASQVPNRAPTELRECAAAHLALGRIRKPGQLLIAAGDYDGDTTEIDIVADDAPFLIDSIRAELDRAGITIQYILHPQLVVSRDDVRRADQGLRHRGQRRGAARSDWPRRGSSSSSTPSRTTGWTGWSPT